MALHNISRMSVTTIGTGSPLTLGVAVPGYLSFAQGGVVDGETVPYGIADGPNSEVGTGVYSAGTHTLTRNVNNSTNGNAPISLSGSAQIFITARAQDIGPPSTTYYISAAGNDANNGTSPSSPWATIAKVNTVTPNPGDTFLFRGGDTFSGTITVNAGGRAGAPITYSSYGSGQATISSGNNSGLTDTDFGNIAVTNLILVGSGITTNTGHGLAFTGLNANCQNFLMSGLTISNYGGDGIGFLVGGGATPVIWSNITETQCTVHDCGQNGIQHATNNPAGSGLPSFLAFVNVLTDHCTIYNVTGQNSILKPQVFNGFGTLAQGVNGYTVQYCNIYNNGRLGENSFGGSGSAGPGIYCANGNNVLVQFNEVWGQWNLGSTGHDGGGVMMDFGIANSLVQYNYLHDNMSFGLACGTLTIGGVHQNNNNNVFRYNVLANNGSVGPNTLLPGGIILYTLGAGETLTNLVIYNNTIITKGSTLSYALIDGTNVGHAGSMSGIIANNILIGDANTILLSYYDAFRFIGNDYVGGSSVKKVVFTNITYASIAAWIAASSPTQECIDGASVLVTAGLDPLLSGLPYPIQSPIAGGYVPARASNFELSASSPVAVNGIDLSSVQPYQTAVPFQSPDSNGILDFDFKGGVYFGDVIGSITCSRTATSATDLLPTSPLGASFNTFGANTLRITPGKGLLVEEARTQYLATPGTPATQTTAALAAGAYILWVNGSGSATASNGTATIASSNATNLVAAQGRPAGFTVSSPGTVVITVTGSLNQFQLENDPAGVGLPTSFISAIGTRDADVVSTTGTTINTYLQSFLAAGSSGVNTNLVQITFNIPIGVQFMNNAVLIEDSSSQSMIGLQAYGQAFFDIHVRGVLTFGGVTVQTANDMLFNTRQVIGGRTDKVNGQSLVLNGGAIATGATSSPSIGTTTYIGNRAAKDQALNGYIERIFADEGSPNPVFSAAVMQTNTSTVPISANPLIVDPHANITIPQDFFGNPVPNAGGKYSIGANQPVGNSHGGTVTLNGATPVSVTDPAVTLNSIILFTLKTVGGTVGAVPSVKTITAGGGFSVAGTAGDTSVYNYVVTG